MNTYLNEKNISNEDINFSNVQYNLHLDKYFTLKEDSIWDNHDKLKYNEIDNFIREFQQFQEINNIDSYKQIDVNIWIDIDSFIFEYLYKLVCENRIKDIIWDYGIQKGIIFIPDFNYDFNEKSQIIDSVSKTYGHMSNTDMVLDILRESIGFYSYNEFVMNL